MNREALYIPSIDAKDLYMANHFLDEVVAAVGYTLINKKGEQNLTKYVNTFDYSLDLIKLREVAAKRLRKKDKFSFKYLGKEYSNKVINVTFKYAYKEFNKVKKNTYVKSGYMVDRLIFNDCIAMDETGEIVGVILNHPLEHENELLPDCFKTKLNNEMKTVYVEKNIKVNMKVETLRHDLYENGFTCDGIKYVRLKRSSGSARVGKCLFIDERLYGDMHKWEMCGLKVKEGDAVDLAALEAYIALPTSSIIDTIHISPKNILVIPDYDSIFKDNCIVVENTADGLQTTEKEVEVSNSIFDGQSLIDKSLMGDYDQYGMLLLRNRFFKSCCFNTNISQWFKDNHITEISQLHPKAITLADNVDDIKLITTPNSIKYAKFGKIEEWLSTIDDVFGIVKHEKKTHFFNGNMVQAHYQLLNTVRLSREEVENFLKDSLDYVSKLNTIPEVFRYHIKCDLMDSEETDMSMNQKNEVFYKMMNLSKEFVNTKLYYEFKQDTCGSYIKNMKKGHILINGNYSTLFGNPYEMLLQSIGHFDGNTSLLPGCVHTTQYGYDKKILGCRSPHISTSNILIATNKRHDLIDRYFNLTDEIICINAINENILERLSGADYDSDSMIVSDDNTIINAASLYYDMFKVPVNFVSAKKVKRFYNSEHKADLDFKTSSNKIGEIVNLSQELNSIMWDIVNDEKNSKLSNSELYEKIKYIYYDICQLSVMSGIEIDKAKKEYDVNASMEIKKIRKDRIPTDSRGRLIKPGFLGYISKTKGYYDSDKKNYKYHNTTMDYLIQTISKAKALYSKVPTFKTFSDCFEIDDYNILLVKYSQINSILDICNLIQKKTHAIWVDKTYSIDVKMLLIAREKEIAMAKINTIKMSSHTLVYLIKCIDNPKYSKIARLLFYFVFDSDKLIGNLCEKLDRPKNYLSPEKDGKIEIYGMHFDIKSL